MEPLPDLSTSITVAVIVAVFLFSYALLRISNTPQKKQPPEAGGALPLIGHLHRLRTREPSHITLAKMAEKYGPIFTLRMGMKKALIISDWEIARECFTTHDRIFATRPKLIAIELMGYNYAMMGFSPYGPYWRHMRKIATLELLSNRRLELLQHIRISEIKNSVKELYDLCVNKGENKVKFEMKKWFEDVNLNTTFRIVLGKRFFDAFEGLGNEGEECRKAMKDVFELFGRFVVSDSLPFLKWLDLGGYQKAMKKTAEKLDKVFDKWLKEHQQRRNSDHYKETTQNDFMDVMLSLVQDDDFQFSSYDAHTIIKATCLAMILGGSETTAVTMTWALSLLLNNQEAMKKAQLELEEQVGRERQVKESDVKNLVYLQAIVKETMRLYPAVPLSAPHESMEECVVGGYHIDIGTRLIVNLQKLQRDPLVWEDPCEFRPERFLNKEREDFDVRGQTPQLIPFGSGRRICPGISFALQLVHLTLANLIHGFEIGKVLDEPINMEETIGLTSVKKTPLEVVLIPRLPSCIAEDIKLNSMTVGKYHVVNPNEGHPLPDSYKLIVRVTSTSGNSYHYLDKVESGQFGFVAAEAGDYMTCFWAPDHQPPVTLTVDFEWKTGVAAKDWSNVAKKGSVEVMELELKKLYETAASIQEEMYHLREREEEMQDLNRSTNTKMAWLSLLSLFVCLSVAGLQIWHLKTFFEKKKLI